MADMKRFFARLWRASLVAGMLGCSVAAGFAQTAQAPSDEIRALLERHYGGYAAGGNPGAVFAETALPTWQNCGANGAQCQNREELAGALEHGLHKLIPDMTWEIKEIMASGDKVIVRGQGSGTPVDAFMGLPASGRSFSVMSIDIHTIEGGKIAHTYHLEDWAAALRQLSEK